MAVVRERSGMIGRKFAALDVVEGCDYFDGATFVARLIRRRLAEVIGVLSDGKTSALGLETTGTIRGVNVSWPGHMPEPMEDENSMRCT